MVIFNIIAAINSDGNSEFRRTGNFESESCRIRLLSMHLSLKPEDYNLYRISLCATRTRYYQRNSLASWKFTVDVFTLFTFTFTF